MYRERARHLRVRSETGQNELKSVLYCVTTGTARNVFNFKNRLQAFKKGVCFAAKVLKNNELDNDIKLVQ